MSPARISHINSLLQGPNVNNTHSPATIYLTLRNVTEIFFTGFYSNLIGGDEAVEKTVCVVTLNGPNDPSNRCAFGKFKFNVLNVLFRNGYT